jgi:undecaprenyl-diphosphatase
VLNEAQALLAWIGQHPVAALGLLFLVALTDALFIIGAFVPAAVVLFGMGALVALGTLELWITVAIAAAGALGGDALSFALGRALGERLFETRLFQRYPELLARGRGFFDRHGGKGVVLARFLGPVRSVTPAIAGASGMPAWLFVIADGTAAVVWALVYIIPGMVFGASLGLAAEVAARLVGLLVVSFVLVFVGLWLLRVGIGLFQSHAEQWLGALMDWSRRHRRLGRFGAALADPDQPETPALAGVAVLLLMLGVAWLLAWSGAGERAYPGPLDALVHQTLQDLQTPWGTAMAIAVSRVGEWLVYGPAAAAVLAALLWRQRLRAAAHWIAALAFGVFLWLGLGAVPLLPPPLAFFGGTLHAGRDLVMPTIVYGFAAILFATQRPAQVRATAYATASSTILLIALARLYLGQEWWSLVNFSLVIGLLWVMALGLGYRRHRPERLFAQSFALPVLLTVVLAASLRWGLDSAQPQRTAIPVDKTLSATEWWNGGWAALPATRTDLRGRPGQVFDLQWAAHIEEIGVALAAGGWQPTTPMSPVSALRWLTETTSIAELPVLPLVHAGQHPQMTLRLPGDEQSQRLIRLWPSGWALQNEKGGRPVPVWLGLSQVQRARTYYRLFRYPVAEPNPLPLPPLQEGSPALRVQQVDVDGRPLWLLGPRPRRLTLPYSDAPPAAPVPLPASE